MNFGWWACVEVKKQQHKYKVVLDVKDMYFTFQKYVAASPHNIHIFWQTALVKVKPPGV